VLSHHATLQPTCSGTPAIEDDAHQDDVVASLARQALEARLLDLELPAGSPELRQLQTDWHTRVGAAIAGKCAPVAVEGDVLVLAAAERYAAEIARLAPALFRAAPRTIDGVRIRSVRVEVAA
jgi:hypothetical protein